MIRLASVVAATLLCVACSRQDDASAPPTQAETRVEAKPAPVQPTSEGAFQTAITAEDFAARLQKLSSDQFEGRQPGTIGERMSTAYIKDQFERIGLKPGNKDISAGRVNTDATPHHGHDGAEHLFTIGIGSGGPRGQQPPIILFFESHRLHSIKSVVDDLLILRRWR